MAGPQKTSADSWPSWNGRDGGCSDVPTGYSQRGISSSAATFSHRQPHVLVPDLDPTRRLVAIGPGQARGRHALRRGVASVLAEVEIQELLVVVERGGHVADAAEREAIGRATGGAVWRRVEHDAEVVPGASEIDGACGADARQLPIRAAALVGRALVMVEAVPAGRGRRSRSPRTTRRGPDAS